MTKKSAKSLIDLLNFPPLPLPASGQQAPRVQETKKNAPQQRKLVQKQITHVKTIIHPPAKTDSRNSPPLASASGRQAPEIKKNAQRQRQQQQQQQQHHSTSPKGRARVSGSKDRLTSIWCSLPLSALSPKQLDDLQQKQSLADSTETSSNTKSKAFPSSSTNTKSKTIADGTTNTKTKTIADSKTNTKTKTSSFCAANTNAKNLVAHTASNSDVKNPCSAIGRTNAPQSNSTKTDAKTFSAVVCLKISQPPSSKGHANNKAASTKRMRIVSQSSSTTGDHKRQRNRPVCPADQRSPPATAVSKIKQTKKVSGSGSRSASLYEDMGFSDEYLSTDRGRRLYFNLAKRKAHRGCAGLNVNYVPKKDVMT